MLPDRIGDPVHHCLEHGERFYFHCRWCFDPYCDAPVHLRVARGPAVRKGKRGRK